MDPIADITRLPALFRASSNAVYLNASVSGCKDERLPVSLISNFLLNPVGD